MSTKLQFVQDMQAAATDMAKLKATMADLNSAYFDRGYNSGGANPIVDADVASLGIKASDVTNGDTLASDFLNFLGNAAVTTANRQATVDALRTDE